jgi:hypothetical protein
MRQIPFVVKKTKANNLRRDYWKQLCVIKFPEGRGDVGLSAYQRLREFRRRHELDWNDSLYLEHDQETGKPRALTRLERGRKILAQKENTIADMAVVLAGAGRGTRMRTTATPREEWEKKTKKVPKGDGHDVLDGELVSATVYWAYSIDKNYAAEWSQNVTHQLLDGGKDWKLARSIDEGLLQEKSREPSPPSEGSGAGDQKREGMQIESPTMIP